MLGAPEALGAGALRLRLWRRVSWTPGAEGAPRTCGVVVVVVLAGMMRRDYVDGVSMGGVLGMLGGCEERVCTYHCEWIGGAWWATGLWLVKFWWLFMRFG